MKKMFILFFLIISNLLIYSQVGINTTSPTATLDIVSNANTDTTRALRISNSLPSPSNELVTVLDSGNMGINKTNPLGKLHVVGDTTTNDVLYLENLQGGNTSIGYSNLLINNITGKVVKSSGVSTLMTNYRSSVPQALDQTSTTGQLITFLTTDKQIETATSFNASASTFTILESGLYMI